MDQMAPPPRLTDAAAIHSLRRPEPALILLALSSAAKQLAYDSAIEIPTDNMS
jgi:hypothetical protein